MALLTFCSTCGICFFAFRRIPPGSRESYDPLPTLSFIRIAAFCFLFTFHSAFRQKVPLTGFDDYVNKALRNWGVPGLAISIVKNDRIVLTQGSVRFVLTPQP